MEERIEEEKQEEMQPEPDLLSLLESKVMQAVELIERLREENKQLRSEAERLQNEIAQRDERIRELEGKIQELLHFADEIERFKRERQEIREKLQAIIGLLEDASGNPWDNADSLAFS